MIANPVVMLSMMAEFHHREHESQGKADKLRTFSVILMCIYMVKCFLLRT